MDNDPLHLPQVTATASAARAVASLELRHGPLVIVQSGGCCDGSAPMCIPAADFPLGLSDVRVGEVSGVPVYMGARELRAWRHQDLVLDVEPGYADGLSLAAGTDLHFVLTNTSCSAAPPSD